MGCVRLGCGVSEPGVTHFMLYIQKLPILIIYYSSHHNIYLKKTFSHSPFRAHAGCPAAQIMADIQVRRSGRRFSVTGT